MMWKRAPGSASSHTQGLRGETSLQGEEEEEATGVVSRCGQCGEQQGGRSGGQEPGVQGVSWGEASGLYVRYSQSPCSYNQGSDMV